MTGHGFVPRHEWRAVRRPISWGAVNGALVVMSCGLWLIPLSLYVLVRRVIHVFVLLRMSDR